MRLMIRMFVLAAVSASAAAAFAFDRVTVNVPFNFETGGKTFPAGTYKVESVANHDALTLSSKADTKMSFTWIATPAEFSPDGSALSLNFDIGADGTHALRSIRLGTLITRVPDVREKERRSTLCGHYRRPVVAPPGWSAIRRDIGDAERLNLGPRRE